MSYRAPVYVAPDASWSIARTIEGFARSRECAYTPLPDGSYRMLDDGSVYRVTIYDTGTGWAFGVYRDTEFALEQGAPQ